ncbi:MAG: histidine kinase [Chitinophagaceae bacterium]
MKELLLVAGILTGQQGFSQSEMVRDSLRNLIIQRPSDTVKVLHYFQYGETFETENADSAFFYYKKGNDLSEKLNYVDGKATYVSYSIVILNNQGKFKEALRLCTDLLALLEKRGTKKQRAVAYINTGSEWQYLSDLEEAAKNYVQAAKLAEEIGGKKIQRVASNNLASVFNSLQQYEKGKQYAEKSLVIAKDMEDDYAIASSTINIATSESFLKNFSLSLVHFKEVVLLGEKIADDIIIMDGWLGMADNYIQLNNWQTAEMYYRKVIEMSKKINAPEYELYGYMGLSKYLLEVENLGEAKKTIDDGIRIAQQLGTRIELKDLYLRASELDEKRGKGMEALRWHKKFVALNDSVINEKNTANVNLMEIKYETERKEQQLVVQRVSIRQKNILNGILIGATGALLIISLLSYRTFHQKRKLQEHKIAELEKEKLLSATQSLLKGQEDERSRLARDLHDGLGGLLSGVKLQLGAMKGNLILSEEHGRTFNNALSKLDESISEMRRVAHNMMPEALMKLGLQQALQDYCDGLSEAQSFKINGEFYGLEKRMESSIEIVVYRIVQELLNNAVKHSDASTILAQVIRNDKNLSITIEDNGRGFNKETVRQGAGLKNIQSRVGYLKGQMDIKSEPGKGTSIHIDCLIEENG